MIIQNSKCDGSKTKFDMSKTECDKTQKLYVIKLKQKTQLKNSKYDKTLNVTRHNTLNVTCHNFSLSFFTTLKLKLEPNLTTKI